MSSAHSVVVVCGTVSVVGSIPVVVELVGAVVVVTGRILVVSIWTVVLVAAVDNKTVVFGVVVDGSPDVVVTGGRVVVVDGTVDSVVVAETVVVVSAVVVVVVQVVVVDDSEVVDGVVVVVDDTGRLVVVSARLVVPQCATAGNPKTIPNRTTTVSPPTILTAWQQQLSTPRQQHRQHLPLRRTDAPTNLSWF
jgi:hypothetical protein